MSIELTTLIIWTAFMILMATGFSVAMSMLAIAVGGFLIFIGPQALGTLFPTAFRNITLDIFISLPMFVLMATLLQVSGAGERLYHAMHLWMAGLRGGLAIGTVLICTLIAGMTGMGGTATIMMGMLAYPEMRKRGYDKMMALGGIPLGGALGPIIPPSIPMILVGSFGGLSVGKLFMAGVFPGLLSAFLFIAYIGVRCFFKPSLGPPIPASERASWKEKFISLRGAILPVLLVLLVLGGIYGGIFTPSEAGGIGAVGALVVAAFYRNLNWKNMKFAVYTTFKVNAMVMWLIIGGTAFSSLLGITRVTHFVSSLIAGLPMGPYGILFVMMLLLFILGMFIENVAIIMITLPIMLPVAIKIGFDPLWFALLYTMMVVIGMVTPPFGYNLFYLKGLGHPDVSLKDIYRSVMPYIPLFLLALVLCIIFPAIVLWLPNAMIK